MAATDMAATVDMLQLDMEASEQLMAEVREKGFSSIAMLEAYHDAQDAPPAVPPKDYVPDADGFNGYQVTTLNPIAPWLEDGNEEESQVPIASVSHQKSRSSFKHSVSNLSLKRSTPNLLASSSEVALDFTLMHDRDRDRYTERNPLQPVHHKKSFLGGLMGGFNKNKSSSTLTLLASPVPSVTPAVRPGSPNRSQRKKRPRIKRSVPPPLPAKEPEIKLDVDAKVEDLAMQGIVASNFSSGDSVEPTRHSFDNPRGSYMSEEPSLYRSHTTVYGASGSDQHTMFVNPFSNYKSSLPHDAHNNTNGKRYGASRRTSPASSIGPLTHAPYLSQPRQSVGTISGLAIPEVPSTSNLSQAAAAQDGTSPSWMAPESWGVKPKASEAEEPAEESSGSEHEGDNAAVPYTPRSPNGHRNSSLISMTASGLLKNDSMVSAPTRARIARDSIPLILGGSTPQSTRLSFTGRSFMLPPPLPSTYRLRIYRPDGSWSSVEANVNQTVGDLQPVLARKALLNRDSARLFIREMNRERILTNTERPAAILKRRLEQIGYDPADNGEKLGSEEINFFLTFIFKSVVPTDEEPQKDIPFEQYEWVDLSGRGVSVIPIALHKHAERIVRLDASRNPMLDIPKDFIDSCTSLRELILAGSALKRIPINVRHANGLRWLDLSSNRIHKLDDAALDMLPSLATLRLQNNRIETLPAYFGRMVNLLHLNISNNKLDKLPDVVAEMTSIVDLDISFNTITVFPPQILALTMLETLVVVGNSLSAFPPDCSSLVTLRSLDCRRNILTDLTPVSRLPQLVELLAEDNQVPALDLTLGPELRTLEVGKNDITRLVLLQGPQEVPTAYSLMSLDISNAKLSALDDVVFGQLTSLTHLKLDNNQFRSVPTSFGKLTQLISLSFTDNQVDVLPDSICELQRLETLNVRNNNLSEIPAALWKCASLRWLNATSNVIDTFALPPTIPRPEDLAEGEPDPRPPLALSLANLYLGDNHLTDDVWSSLVEFQQLRLLNLSLNDLTALQGRTPVKFASIEELYLSGNAITALPDDIHLLFPKLTTLYLNGNKLQSLPVDMDQLAALTTLDVGSNQLKYNINNFQFEWNWNHNTELRYLNLAGNRRLEIKRDHAANVANVAFAKSIKQQAISNPSQPRWVPQPIEDLSEFSRLQNLRVLGLMDVNTVFMPPVPDENHDFRVRTSFSEINGMAYGIADTLGRGEHVTMFDLVVPNFRSRDNECLFGMFGRAHSVRMASRPTKFLQENFASTFVTTLRDLKADKNERTPDALRRAFLTLNKNLHEFLSPANPNGVGALRKASRVSANLPDDPKGAGETRMGASAIVVYIVDKTLYVANVGHALAVISRNGVGTLLSVRHDPLDRNETARIRKAEAWVSPKGTVNDEADTSRSFGIFHLLPAVNSRPTVRTWTLEDFDDILIIANRGLWDYMSYQTAVDVARTMDDPMLASQKLRDLAMSYGADGSTMVMVLKVGDLVGNKGRRTWQQPSGNSKQRSNTTTAPSANQLLKHLGAEVEPPTGSVALVFTDIQNSTRLWDLNAGMPTAMRLHNNLLRRLLRLNGGYEVKTEGDAFVVSFQDVMSAVNFCLEVQVRLLQEEWPLEILESEDGREERDKDGTMILRGVSVRMGIHRGNPVCEPDPVTKRMDYFGGVMNRAARISGFAQGGQISLSQEVANEIRRTIVDGTVEVDEEIGATDESIKRMATIDSIKRIGVFIKEVGEKKLKGLEVPEVLSIMYPAQLKARLELHEQRAAGAVPKSTSASASRVQFSATQVRELALLCARLETLSTNRVLRWNGEQRPPKQDEDGRIVHADQSLFIPALGDSPSDADTMVVFDSLSIRIQNALESLDKRPPAVEEENMPSLDDLLAMFRQRSPDEQMALAAALGLQPAAV